MSDDELLAAVKKPRSASHDTLTLIAKQSSIDASDKVKTPASVTAASPTVDMDEKVSLEFPKDFLRWGSGGQELFPDAEKLLFPEPARRLSSLSPSQVVDEGLIMHFHSMQHWLQCLHNISLLSNDVKKWRDKSDKLTGEVKKLTEEVKNKEAEVIAEKKKVDRLLKEKADSEAKVEGLNEDLKWSAFYYAWSTKAKLMKEFKEGHTSHWEPDVVIKKFEDAMAEDPDATTSGAIADTATSRNNDMEGGTTPKG